MKSKMVGAIVLVSLIENSTRGFEGKSDEFDLKKIRIDIQNLMVSI